MTVKNPKYRHKNSKGYVRVKQKDHPRSNNGYVFEHILIAEKALGEYLPEGVVIHHLDGNPANNKPSNLVICPDSKYHSLLHRRTRAKKISGNANYILCNYCKQYDDPKKLYVTKKGNNAFHRECQNMYNRQQYHKRKALKEYGR